MQQSSLICPTCKSEVLYKEVEDHTLSCSSFIRKCNVPNCNFSASNDEFLSHVLSSHMKEFIKSFDSNFSSSLSDDKPKNIEDPIKATTNSQGRKARLGSSGKFYCGGKLNGSCTCCNGNCGPGNGCNCGPCMALDIKARKLAKGYWVNRDGATCRRGQTGHVYCGRKMNISGSDGYCGPTDGPNCQACIRLESMLSSRYNGVN